MECIKCDLTNICKIYEFISSQRAVADISVEDCRVKRREGVREVVPIQGPTITEEPTEPKVRSAEAIASVSERIKKLSAPEPVKQETFSECPECKQGANPSDICDCEGCKKQLCIGCAVEDGPTKKFYCEDCWDDL